MGAPAQIDLEELRRLNDMGWGSNRLARHFGSSHDRIRHLRVKLGLKTHDQRVSAEDRAKLELASSRCDEGATIAEAAQEFGVSPRQLKSWRKRHRKQDSIVRAPRPKNDTEDLAMRAKTERLIAAWDRRRAAAGGVPWTLEDAA